MPVEVSVTYRCGAVTFNSLLQSHTPAAVRGRIFAGFDMFWQLGRLLSLLIGGVLAAAAGIQAVYYLGGALLILAAVIGAPMSDDDPVSWRERFAPQRAEVGGAPVADVDQLPFVVLPSGTSELLAHESPRSATLLAPFPAGICVSHWSDSSGRSPTTEGPGHELEPRHRDSHRAGGTLADTSPTSCATRNGTL